MENNQQRKDVTTNSTSKNLDSNTYSDHEVGQQASANESANANLFAETANTQEQHSESSKPDAENQTLGTP